MFSEKTNQQDTATSDPILVEFTRADDGPRPVAWYSIKKKPELEKKSIEVMDKAMDTIHKMADKVNNTIQMLENRPDHVEMEFGIKFDAEIGAIVAKVTTEASMTIKMVWAK
jgi:hypothetical protein